MQTYQDLEEIVEFVSNLLAQLEAEAFQEEGFSELSMRQIHYLNTVMRMEHPTFSDLARELGVTKPSVTNIVGALTRKGYLEKIQDKEDRRAYHLTLTPKGIEFSQVHAGMHRRIINLLTSQLTFEEVEQLTRLLSKALSSA